MNREIVFSVKLDGESEHSSFKIEIDELKFRNKCIEKLVISRLYMDETLQGLLVGAIEQGLQELLDNHELECEWL